MHSFRKHALVCASILLTCFTLHSQQTTTLGQLETSNTSAPPGFTGTVTKTNGTQVDNGLPPARPISDVPIQSLITYGSPRVFVHLQGWFCTPATNNACDGHIVIGNNDHDSTHIQAVVDDMRRRGISGVMVDWYGPSSWSDKTAQLVQTYADQICASAGNPTPCPFSVGFVIDAGASEYSGCTSTTCTQIFENDVNYIDSTYYNGHGTGLRTNDGRPIVANFELQQYAIDFGQAHSNLSAFNPVFIFNGRSEMPSNGGDGAYEWVYPQSDPNNDNTSGVSSFYSSFPAGKIPIGTGYIGFDDSAASWGKGRKMNRRCGKTWLQIVNDINGPQSVPVDYVQLPTWDDYEEGSELETGIDNCLTSITGSTSGDTLTLKPIYGAQPFDVNPQPSDVGDASSLSRYDVWYTTQDPSQAANDNDVSLTLAGSAPAANGTIINLANGSFQFPANTQVWLFVNAVGQPFIQNHINTRANAIPYTTGSGGGGTVSLTPASNNFGTVNQGSTSAPATFTLDNGTSSTLASLTTSVTGEFQKQSTTCSSTLAAGASCTVNVVFAPTSSGAQSGTLTANYSGGSQSAQLSGNGQAGNDGDGIEDGPWTCTGSCTTPQPNSQSQDGGSSMQFSYTGGAAYSNASYDTTLSNSYSGTSQFKLDFWAYIANPSAPQAFVIKADQVVGGLEYPFLFQCDFKGTQLWRVWNPVSQNWVSSTVGCAQFSASTWNHLILNFSRTSSNQLLYQNIVINNVTYPFNLTESAISNSNAASMNIGLTLDGDSAADTYSYLIDEMTLSQQPTNGATNIDDGGGWTCSGSCQAAAVDTSIQKDGSSVRLAYSGGAAYDSGSWSKTLTQDFSSGQNYSLDFWAYIQNPAASQAMVFTADQVVGGKEYPFQLQCDFNGTKLWRVWNPSTNNWDSTSVGCSEISANTWNHFTLHFSRTSSNQLYYQDIVINGPTYSFNMYENPISNTNSASMKVKVVLDGNSSGTAYSLWLDEVSLTF